MFVETNSGDETNCGDKMPWVQGWGGGGGIIGNNFAFQNGYSMCIVRDYYRGNLIFGSIQRAFLILAEAHYRKFTV